MQKYQYNIPGQIVSEEMFNNIMILYLYRTQRQDKINPAEKDVDCKVKLLLSQSYFFFYFFFLIWVLQPFQEYLTYIESIIHQRWAKTAEPGKNHLTICKQNLAFPCDLGEAQTTVVRKLMDKEWTLLSTRLWGPAQIVGIKQLRHFCLCVCVYCS